ncbi:cytochrome biogenesis protein [Thiohalobacter sp. COW1]|uniref:Urease accessory protein UreH-like transmembrane domain-containing protein n=1 Tax=Thiohalobacter thiocyanaticus TaxID=585455 RepID=A0A1Z4VV28_9GAMM|nr:MULTISPECIES: sulfite exporter TauE/SafE family protein [Thiohalobacter]BAZ95383.1 uncharacterized protein FOKN1_3026 [Thiohalobacter thiocyanaticus]BCO32667.1 cytochrome biogenesis protein [Thiohalobacter sp. COW1]
MLSEVNFLAAFLVGLLGGVHCVGMCGGIVGALSFGLPESTRQRPLAQLPYLVAYNGGRILSYTVAGAAMGGISALAMHLLDVRQAQLVLQLFAGAFLILMGLYLAGWWLGLARVEGLGARLWRHIEPLGRRLLPVSSAGHAFALGLIWGWLPCGLVYSVLIWSLSAGSAAQGAWLMLGFGLGTLPNLLLMGVVAARMSQWLRKPWVRRLAGAAVIVFGVVMIGRSLWQFA